MNGFDQHTNPSCFLRQPGRILQCRLVMDPERFPDDRDEAMAAKGMGAVYVSTSDGRRLRAESFDARDRHCVMHDLYWPYSNALQNVVAAQLD